MRCACIRNAPAGVTLVEVLAVVVLLALAAGAAATGLGAAARHGAIESAVADAMALDQAARRLALTAGPLVLETVDRHRLLVVRDGAGVRHTERAMPRGISCRIEAGTASAVRFDRTGRTTDYRVRITDRAGSRSWLVSGSTGWMTPEAPL